MAGCTDRSEEASICVPTLRGKIVEHRGLLAAFVGTFATAGGSVCVRLLKGDVPFVEVVCLRFLLQGVFSVVSGVFSGMPIPFESPREGVLLFARGICGTGVMGLLYFAVYDMSVGLATAIVFGAPVFVGILAWIFMNEAFQYRDVLLVFVNFTGVILIAQPPFFFKSETFDITKKMELIAVAAAVVSMLLNACSFIFLRQLGLIKTSAIKIVFYYAICGTVIPIIGGIVTQDWVIPPCGRPRYLLVLLGFLNFVAQSLISYGLACTTKSYFVSVVNSNQIPVTIILEIAVLHELPDRISLLGTALVVASAIGVVFREGRMSTERNSGENGHDLGATNEVDDNSI